MNRIVSNIGLFIGIIGVFICMVGGVARISGFYYMQGLGVSTWFDVGVSLLVAACFIKLYNKN